MLFHWWLSDHYKFFHIEIHSFYDVQNSEAVTFLKLKQELNSVSIKYELQLKFAGQIEFQEQNNESLLFTNCNSVADHRQFIKDCLQLLFLQGQGSSY